MSAQEAALGYLSRGWLSVPIPYQTKFPVLQGWQQLRLTAEQVPEYFNGAPQNIGVLLGEPSGNLVDVDIDCPEALDLAADFLPPTDAVFGRLGKPLSHRLYISAVGSTQAFKDPEKPEHNEMLVELRSTGGQTVFPPSTHKGTGEAVEWQDEGDPAPVSPKRLITAVKGLAAASLLARAAPAIGRHDYLLAISGPVARWLGDEADGLLRAVGRQVMGELFRELDHRRTMQSTLRKLDNGGKVTGFPALVKEIGEKRAKQVREWLGGKPDAVEAPEFDAIEALDWEALNDLDPPPRVSIIDGWLPLGVVTSLYGPGGVGKTLLAQLLASCVVLGRPFLGIETLQCNVLMLAAEDDPDELHRRRCAINNDLGSLKRDLAGKLIMQGRVGLNNVLMAFTKGRPAEALPLLGHIEQTARDRQIKLIILDNVAQMFVGEENSRADVVAFINALAGLAQRLGAAVLLLGHPPKNGADYSGSTAWRDIVRCLWTLKQRTERDSKGEETVVDGVVLAKVKANYGETGQEIPLIWQMGTFKQEGPADPAAAEQEVATVFLQAMAELTKREISLSASPFAHKNYAPKLIIAHDLSQGHSKQRLADAMRHLLFDRRIKEKAKLWRGEDRNWVYGLARSDQSEFNLAEVDDDSPF